MHRLAVNQQGGDAGWRADKDAIRVARAEARDDDAQRVRLSGA